MNDVKLLESDFERVERLLRAISSQLERNVGVAILQNRQHLFWFGLDMGDDQLYVGGDTLREAYTGALVLKAKQEAS